MMEGSGERATGTPNTIYDLSSVLFHALEGGASYDQYVQDAEEAGDRDLADFFRQVRDEDSARADEAQRLLAERTPSATAGMGGAISGAAVSGEGVATGVPPRTEPGGMPGTEPLAEELPPPRAEERPLGPEEVPPPMTEDRPLGTEGTMPPRTEAAPPRTEGVPPPRTEEVSPGAGEAPLSEERERDQGEDRGLIDRVRDAISGEEERGRGEGPDEPRRR